MAAAPRGDKFVSIREFDSAMIGLRARLDDIKGTLADRLDSQDAERAALVVKVDGIRNLSVKIAAAAAAAGAIAGSMVSALMR